MLQLKLQSKYRAFVRKRNEVATVITAADEINIIIWRFAECKDLWENAETKHKDHTSTLDQSNEKLLQKQEAWVFEIQQDFLELE